MYQSSFQIPGMDCASEEQMIKLKLEGLNFNSLRFDLSKRRLYVYHENGIEAITLALAELGLGAQLIKTEVSGERDYKPQGYEKKLLWVILLINLGLFILELLTGILSGSMGLVADSLDMLADSIVYSFSLYAIGRTAHKKKSIAKLSGYFQILLAIFGFLEVLRRFAGYEAAPEFLTMISVSLVALIGNAACLYLLRKTKSDEAHMKASLIFTSNDVVVNLGIIAAGVLVYVTGSKYPDLLIGSVVFILVARAAMRILKLAK